MKLSDLIRDEIEKNKDGVLAPIVENLSKYLAKELRNRDYASVIWVYDKDKEEVNENHAFVYYERKVALLAWIREQGFRWENGYCWRSGANTGIHVRL